MDEGTEGPTDAWMSTTRRMESFVRWTLCPTRALSSRFFIQVCLILFGWGQVHNELTVSFLWTISSSASGVLGPGSRSWLVYRRALLRLIFQYSNSLAFLSIFCSSFGHH